jgi:Salmonella virulence plasmid 65kDa B protein/Insecticide toxin TcdB middle/N-terminal region/FG-GAP-like repeat
MGIVPLGFLLLLTPLAPAFALSSTGLSGPRPSTQDLGQSSLRAILEPDPTTGALTYGYPITVPPGRGGMQPDLKLQYNSQDTTQDSIFGFGWSINIPYITRVNKKGVDKLYSADSSDWFFESSLDGELVLASSAGTKLTYRSKVEDGSFNSYLFDTSTNAWVVTAKNGTVFLFDLIGTSSALYSPANSNQVAKWFIDKEVDANGNYITYNYFKDGYQIYPDTISYANSASRPGLYGIKFERAPQEPRSESKNGFELTTNYVISAVSIAVQGVPSQKYVLNYAIPSTARSYTQISSITLTSLKLPQTSPQTTSFAYSDSGNVGFTESQTYQITDAMGGYPNPILPIDYNGDGLVDIIDCNASAVHYFKNTGSGWVADTSITDSIPAGVCGGVGINTSYITDINGDGLPDFISAYTGYGNQVYRNTRTGWVLDPSIVVPKDVVYIGSSGSRGSNDQSGNFWYSGWHADDLNGDGIPDFILEFFDSSVPVGTPPYGCDNWSCRSVTKVYLSNGNASWTESREFYPQAYISLSAVPNGQSTEGLADMNNDGLADILTYSPLAQTSYYLNNGSSFDTSSATNFPKAGQDGYHLVLPMDMNGDGYMDFLTQDAAESSQIFTDPIISWASKQIFLNQHNGAVQVSQNGIGFSSLSLGQFTWGYIPSVFSLQVGPFTKADVNGDGLLDLIEFGQVPQVGNVPPQLGFFYKHVYINTGQIPGRLTSIILPTGGNINVTYKSSAEYKDSAGNLLNPKLPFVVQTVNTITATDTVNNVSETDTYTYADGSFYFDATNPLIRKFAGFGIITKTDSSGNVTKTFFHQGNASDFAHGEYNDEYWKIGKPYRVEVRDTSGKLYSKTINTWDSVDLGNGAKFVKLVKTLEQDYEGSASQ